MNTYLVLAIGSVVLIFVIVFGVKMSSKKIASKEAYTGPVNVSATNGADPSADCKAMYPLAPTEVPQSAYAELMAPLILTSENNPPTAKTLHDSPGGGYSYDFYNDKYVCNTPWNMTASSNDSCAQYGIGERAEGPPGHQFCVCNAQMKNGQPIGSSKPSASEIVISVGSVCTQDSQCCTNFCGNVPGQFSKMCMCEPGFKWDEDSGECVGMYTGNQGGFSSMYDDRVESFRPPPKGAVPTNGKLCASHKECGLGEACTPSNFCASQLLPTTETYGNKFDIGANCTSDDQCGNNMICSDGNCACPDPLIYSWSSHTCGCVDGSKSQLGNSCVKPSELPRKFCPTTPPGFSRGWQDCGLGEVFVAGSGACACVTDLTTFHQNRIGKGGRCETTAQCRAGECKKIGDISVCLEPSDSLWNLAVSTYI
jgi:hypothetical protein